MGIGKGRRSTHPSYIDKDTGVTMKYCRYCGKYKPIDEFHHNKANKDGHEFECKLCHNARVLVQHRKRAEQKKALKEAQKKEEPKLNVVLKVDTPIVNDLLEMQENLAAITTIHEASDDQLVEELKRRGYTGNIIRKTSFIL